MKDKKEKKKWGLILFIVIIMIGTSFSFIFFGFSPVAEKVKYKGSTFTFLPSQNIWISKISDIEAAFSFLPSDVESINLPIDILHKLQNKFEIDVTSDLNNTFKESIALAQHQMGLTLAAYNIYIRRGFTTNNTFNLPIITCNDSSLNVPVIYFKQGNETKIYTKDNCIIAEALTNADFVRVKDRLLYGILGVIK